MLQSLLSMFFIDVNVIFDNIFCSLLTMSLCNTECVHLLLAHGAPVKIKNSQGWNPLAEAISYGDRQTSK